MEYLGHKIINKFRSQTPRGFYDPAKGHTGIDLNFAEGTPVTFPAELTMIESKIQHEMGHVAYLKDVDGNVLVFAHLSAVIASKGDFVPAGTVFAKSGNTGTASTGAHLHFEIIASEPESGLEFMTRILGEFKGFNIDPESYLTKVVRESTESLPWLRKHELIFGEHGINDPVRWGELEQVLKRFVPKIKEWTKDQ